ncbi:hypothetical protein RB195_015029 [Necator americanus]|uniref:BZIP domain-containing protein n=1 Tax=Necator americanus TaxID=51031 RepID=A0ABR1E5B8_NECAM
MNDEDVLERMDEAGGTRVKLKTNETSEDVVIEQIGQEAQQARAQMATYRMEPARRNADRVEPARAQRRVPPEAPGRDTAREREQRRRRLRAELRNAQQERDDLRFMLQELEKLPTCPERRCSRMDVRPSEQGIIRCVLRRSPTAL